MRARRQLGRLGMGLLGVAMAACASPSSSHPATTTTSRSPRASSTTGSVVPASASSWTTAGGGPLRQADDTVDGALTHVPTRRWASPTLDGPVYGQPLVDGGVVYVATENDTVYALDATDGSVEWQRHLATPVPAGALPCGDITPTVGVTSTMVLDPSLGRLFVSAAVEAGGVTHHLYAIDTSTHQVVFDRDLDQPGWVAAAQLQRTGLALDDGSVLVGFGGNDGDCAQYHGWVVSVPESGVGAGHAYQVPTSREGAVWAPTGIAVDGSGDAFISTGNGAATPGQPFDRGDAVVELSPQLTEEQYFAPTDWAQDNAADLDLGSTAPVLLGDGRLATVGKQAVMYLVSAGHLGGIGGQLGSIEVCEAFAGLAYDPPDLYVPCASDERMEAVRVGSGGTMNVAWTWQAPGEIGAPTAAMGSLWVVALRPAELVELDPTTGAEQAVLPLDVGTPEHFAGVSAAEGMLVVAGSKAVEAFG